MAKKKKILYPVLFMVGLTALYTFILASINQGSLEIIKQQEALAEQKSILYVFGIDAPDSNSATTDLYTSKIETVETKTQSYYIHKTSDGIKGYAFPFSGKGLWGSISGHIALSTDFKTVLGLNFTSHSETPGLGGRIDEDWFKDQFRNLDVSASPYVVFRPSDSGNVDAITGATLTSKSVSTILNDFMADLDTFAQKEGLYD